MFGDTKKPKAELKEVDTREVSLVDRPANEVEFLVVKSADGRQIEVRHPRDELELLEAQIQKAERSGDYDALHRLRMQLLLASPAPGLLAPPGLAGLGRRLDGLYRFTKVRHVMEPGRLYTCEFTAHKVVTDLVSRRKPQTKTEQPTTQTPVTP
jgi:hypothetical protein